MQLHVPPASAKCGTGIFQGYAGLTALSVTLALSSRAPDEEIRSVLSA